MLSREGLKSMQGNFAFFFGENIYLVTSVTFRATEVAIQRMSVLADIHVLSFQNIWIVFNDRFFLSFFVAMHGFRESDFDYY